MRWGHALVTAGGAVVLIAGTSLDWVHFEVAGVSVEAFRVPAAGQLAVGLAGLAVLLGIAGLFRGQRRWQTWSAIVVSALLLSTMLLAAAAPGGGVALVAGEVVALGPGHGVGVLGSMLCLLGAFGLVAATMRPDPRRDYLRVRVEWQGQLLCERYLDHDDRFTLGPGRADLAVDLPGLDAPRALLVGDRRLGYALQPIAGLRGHVVRGGEHQELGDPLGDQLGNRGEPGHESRVPLRVGDWGAVDVGTATVRFQFVRPPKLPGVAGFFGVDEVLLASVAVSFLLQAAILLAGIFSEPPEVTRSSLSRPASPALMLGH